eukprot:12197870-Alexandrium_andersonii.AAC.1
MGSRGPTTSPGSRSAQEPEASSLNRSARGPAECASAAGFPCFPPAAARPQMSSDCRRKQ